MISQKSKQTKNWIKSYLYQSILVLLHLKGKPNKERVFKICLNGDSESVVSKLYRQMISTWLMKVELEHRNEIKDKLELDRELFRDFQLPFHIEEGHQTF
jgi:hypothetical protein